VKRSISILFICLSGIALCWSVYRDIQIEKQYPGDLRNRVVGSRLQKDGHLPYFYKWNKNDGLRYYDPQNFDSLQISNITATPFFHQLLYPIVDLSQRTISKIWLCFEYFMLIIMVVIGILLAKNKNQQWAVVITALLFLFTNAWTGHIAAGQLYLVIPFFMMLYYYFLSRQSNFICAALAGICAAMLLLIRPNTIFFFLPILFIAHLYTAKFKIIFVTSAFAIFLLAFGGTRERKYWKEYKSALAQQVKSHQGLHPAMQQNEADPHFISWEGWNTDQVSQNALHFPYTYNREHGNVFILINHALNIKISVWLLAILSFVTMAMISFLFYKRISNTTSFSLYQLTILAFCLYMVSDIFSPIHRFQYNASQWLFPLILIASRYHFSYKKIYAGILVGLILNSIDFPFMLMEQSMGEYLVFLSVLILLFAYKLPNHQS